MAFRRIDVDCLDEERLQDSDFEALYPHPLGDQLAEHVEQLSRQIKSLVSRGDAASILPQTLTDPPYGATCTPQLRATHLETVMSILLATRAGDMASVTKELTIEQQDVLMAYIYKGLGHPEKYASGTLLQWHDKLAETAGTGCIVRVLSDKRGI